MKHLEPRVGHRVEVLRTVEVVDTIVQFHCLIPVVGSRESCEAVVTGSFGRKLDISVLAAAQVYMRRELLMGDIVEIV